jgi:type IV pilus assembly protein PilO
MAASSGAMADFARMPTSRKALVFVVIGALLGLLYWQFVYKSLESDLDAAEAENKAKAAQNKKAADDIPKYEELKTRMKDLTQIISENQKALPTEAEVPAFFETLEKKVTESGVEISKWKKLPESPVETFVRVPVEVEVVGTFMQIKRFFASLIQRGVLQVSDGAVEERERIISIENLSLTDPEVKNREIVMTAKFTAVTFRQEDKVEPPPPKPGAAPAAPAAAPAKTGATPPLPPSNTPAGAKVRTENAIDKGTTRTDDKLKGGM